MDLDRFRERAAQALADIAPANENSPDEWEGHRLSLDLFPLPDLVLFGLTRLLDIEALGRGEKVAWSVKARFRDRLFEISLRKFGFQLIVPKGTPEEHRLQLVRCLQTAAKLAAQSLQEFALQQIDAGNSSIENQYRIFDGAYRFFRQEATSRYAASQLGTFPLFDAGLAEGGYCASAMLNAYFSRLEHMLVLALPFTEIDLGNGALRRFAANVWLDKLKALFDLDKDATAKRIRDILGQVKDRFRNPLSHGGFDKKGSTFHFSVPGIGAFPVLLADHKTSVERFVSLVSRSEFRTLCQQLDECDALFEESTVGPGVKFAKTCLPVSFSAQFRAAGRKAAKSPEALQEFIDYQIEMADMHMNMDY
jgi:hypothetical protein